MVEGMSRMCPLCTSERWSPTIDRVVRQIGLVPHLMVCWIRVVESPAANHTWDRRHNLKQAT